MNLLAIDPGPVESAWLIYNMDERRPVVWNTEPNGTVRDGVACASYGPQCQFIAIEMVASYGMAVGADVFETCVQVGRFEECWETWAHFCASVRIFRRDVKMHLCGSMKAKDANIRQALIDRYGPGKDKAIGKKASPGPLYGLSGHAWAALGVAVTAAETKLSGLELAA